MTNDEYLLTCLSEECAEVIQRIDKALRFGMMEIQTGHTLTNRARIVQELTDLEAVKEMCEESRILPNMGPDEQAKAEKKIKVRNFMGYSREIGTLTDK